MWVVYSELERLTDLFTLGAYFISMVFGAFLLFKLKRHHLHEVAAWVLVWWAFLVFDGYIGYLFDISTPEGLAASQQYDSFANILDMTAVVSVVMIGYALTYARKVTFGLVFVHSVPFLGLMCALILTHDTMWEMAAYIWTLLYSMIFLAYFSLQIRAYVKRVHDYYSDDTARGLHWLYTLLWVFLAMLLVWAIPTYLKIRGTYVLFYCSSIALWWFVILRLLKQQPVNIRYFSGTSIEPEGKEEEEHKLVVPQMDETVEADSAEAHEPAAASDGSEAVDAPSALTEEADAPVVERRFAFAPKLERLFAVDQVYLQPDLNINELARMLGTNRAYLSAYLNNVKQVTFFDYVNYWRLRKAEKLLYTTTDTVDMIADACGFNNTYSFRRVFIRLYEYTPSEWRHLSPEAREEICNRVKDNFTKNKTTAGS